MRGIFLYLLFGFALVQAENNYSFEHFTADQGLLQNSITQILQDNKGFLWLGTYNGLNRFDGNTFKNYITAAGDSSDNLIGHISAIFENSKKDLWIGTLGNGIFKLDKESGQFVTVDYIPSTLSSVGIKRISSIFEDRHDNLWIATWAGGLIKYTENPREVKYFSLKDATSEGSPPIVKQICQDENGILWFATNQTLVSYNYTTDNAEYFPLIANDKRNDLTCITIGPLGCLWVGSWGEGLFKFDRQTKTTKQYKNINANIFLSNNQVNSIYNDEQGKLWIGTNGGGLNILDIKNESIEIYQNDPSEPESLSSNIISAVYRDRSNVFWIGTEFGGLNKLYPLRSQFNHISLIKKNKSLSSAKSILCLLKDKSDQLWFGTFGGGLIKYNRNNELITQYLHNPQNRNSLTHNIVRSVISDKNHNLWIGTDGGINKYNTTTGSFQSYNTAKGGSSNQNITNVFCLYEDVNGAIWAGCFLTGLLKYDKDIDGFVNFLTTNSGNNTINDNSIWSVTGDEDNNLWFGTETNSLNKYIIGENRFENYGNELLEMLGQPIEKIMVTYHSSQNILWLGTAKGMVKFDYRNKTAKLFTVKDGLSSNVIQSITEDTKGNLWIGTVNGLCHFDIKQGVFKIYNVSDGIQASEFHVNSAFTSKDGELLFGGVNGCNAFYPEGIVENLKVPNVVITNFLISNQEVPVGPNYDGGRLVLKKNITDAKQVFLTQDDKMITFEFAALDFVSPGKNEYEYMLEGFDHEGSGWNKVGNRKYATYTNLPPGEYTFRVRGTNNDGVINIDGTSVNVFIKPPFWYHTWVWMLIVAILIFVVWIIYRQRVLSVKQKNEELERIVNQRTDALQNANQDLEHRNKKIEEQSAELTKQKESLEEINSLLIERQEEIEHQALKLQLQANSLEESNGLLLEREGKIRKQAEMLEEQAESLQENNRKLIERQEEVEHQTLKLKVQSDALKESNELLEARERKIRHQANKLEGQAESLKNANTELEKLNATKDRFFSIIAHDLRNPINAILGFSELISSNYEAIEDAKKIELNKIIHQSTKNVYNLLENLLQWSRSQTNRIRYEPVLFDLQGIINENIILSKGNAKKKNLELVTEFDEKNEVCADKNMTSTLLRNLLTNAIKFTKPFGKIVVSTKVVKDYIQICVADNGIGMSEDIIDKLFRIDSAHSTYGTSGEMGTGLGLIICKEFVDKQGGEIWVDSEVNKGTKFTFTLPTKLPENTEEK